MVARSYRAFPIRPGRDRTRGDDRGEDQAGDGKIGGGIISLAWSRIPMLAAEGRTQSPAHSEFRRPPAGSGATRFPLWRPDPVALA